jgi:transposase
MLHTNLTKILDFNGQEFYIGLDVHKKSWAVTIRSLGIQVAHFTQPPSPENLLKYLNKNFPGGSFYSAYEAGFSGTHHHEDLCKLGIKNMVVHPGDIPSTDKQKKNKTDLHDSRYIASYLEQGSLHGIHVLTRQQQELRSLFRCREKKVRDATRATNRLKNFIMYFGIKLPDEFKKSERLSLNALAWLNNLDLVSISGSMALKQHVEELIYHRKKVFQITKLLRTHIQASYLKEYQWILSIPGIGGITTMGFIAEIADFKRFEDQDEYTSFLGLCPWEDGSGDQTRTKGIQPRCNKHLRPLIIEASWCAIRNSPLFFSYYSRHAQKNSKKAIVKVARKLALTVRAVVTKGQFYQAEYLQNKQQINEQQKEEPKQKRFSSGTTEKHVKKITRKSLKTFPG